MSKFHAKAGAGYAFIGDICLEVDKINPQVLSHTAIHMSTFSLAAVTIRYSSYSQCHSR
jgi:Domain of unknown function (DUF3458_C) ARM repeats